MFLSIRGKKMYQPDFFISSVSHCCHLVASLMLGTSSRLLYSRHFLGHFIYNETFLLDGGFSWPLYILPPSVKNIS